MWWRRSRIILLEMEPEHDAVPVPTAPVIRLIINIKNKFLKMALTQEFLSFLFKFQLFQSEEKILSPFK
jgi:hypothetical protein